MHPTPNETQLHSIYDGYDQTGKYLKKLKKKLFTSKFKLKRVKRYLKPDQINFLDVGCNIGITVEAARRLGFKAMGVDLDEDALGKAKELFPDCEFLSKTTHELFDRDYRFDAIYCAEVIEHLADPKDFMQSLKDLLKPGGVLYLTTPDAGHFRVPKDFTEWKEVKPPEHICFFNKDNMQSLLKNQGFQPLKFYKNHRANMRVIARRRN